MYEESKQLLLAIFLKRNLSFLNTRKYSKNSEIIHAFVLQFVYFQHSKHVEIVIEL